MKIHSYWYIYLSLVLLLIDGGVNAADVPQGSTRDGRIQYSNYNDGDVVDLYLTTGISTRVVFDKTETIVSADTGFNEGYFISTNGRTLTIKPITYVLADGQTRSPVPDLWRTNLWVETDKRLYDFELFIDEEKNAYRLEFKYPVEEAAVRVEVAKQKQIEEEKDWLAIKAKEQKQAAMAEKIKVANFNYTMRIGHTSRNIAPIEAFDDGSATYLKFSKNGEIPEVFITGADGEQIVQSDVDDDAPRTLKITRIAPELILRLGKSVVTVQNKGHKK